MPCRSGSNETTAYHICLFWQCRRTKTGGKARYRPFPEADKQASIQAIVFTKQLSIDLTQIPVSYIDKPDTDQSNQEHGMKINKKKCVGCGNCIPFCTMGVIRVENRCAEVNEDECVECNTCYRGCESENLNPTLVRAFRRLFELFRLRHDAPIGVCPTGALEPPELEWPRNLRRAFSDPTVPHESTGMPGRGTEEIKTNDVTGRIGPGEAGLVIDLGRPGTGVFFYDIDKMTRALAGLEITFEKENPLTALMPEIQTGALRTDILQEKVLSAIIELKLDARHLIPVIETIERVSKSLETVVSVGVASRCDADGTVPHAAPCEAAGFTLSPNGKTNLGLGRPAAAGPPDSERIAT
jgi:ferredoxin